MRPKIGEIIEFYYPLNNIVGVSLEYTRRVVEVRDVISLVESPLLWEQFSDEPLLRRGSLLIDGTDLLTGREGQFHYEARRRGRLPKFRIGVFDPAFPWESVDWLTDPYPHTVLARNKMLRDFEKLEELDFAHLQVGAFPVRS